MEIERKYLVNVLPSLDLLSSRKIVQAYISTDPVIRIRQSDTTYCLCMKSHGHMVREEFELSITKEQFDNLWGKIEFTPIEKTRYYIPLEDGLTAELDVYYNALETLTTVEVEFDSLLSASNFIPPKWFGADITHDNRYKNNHLSMYGLPK